MLEEALRQKTSLKLPKCVSTPLTLSFLLVTVVWFFFPPLVDSGTDDRGFAECRYFFDTLYHLAGVS